LFLMPRCPVTKQPTKTFSINRQLLTLPCLVHPEKGTITPMLRTMCKGKIHRATVTQANLNYIGSITIDQDLLDAANIYPYEQVQVVNLNNGSRLETYTISGARG